MFSGVLVFVAVMVMIDTEPGCPGFLPVGRKVCESSTVASAISDSTGLAVNGGRVALDQDGYVWPAVADHDQ